MKRRAFALAAVLFILAIAVVLGSIYSAHIVSQTRESAEHEYSTQANYVALAGLQYGMHLIRNSPNPAVALSPAAPASLRMDFGNGRVGTARVSWVPGTNSLHAEGLLQRQDSPKLLGRRRLEGTVYMNFSGIVDRTRAGLTEVHLAP